MIDNEVHVIFRLAYKQYKYQSLAVIVLIFCAYYYTPPGGFVWSGQAWGGICYLFRQPYF